MLAAATRLMNNEVMELDVATGTGKFLLIPDLHGESGKLRSVVRQYQGEAPHFVSLGDVLDGGQSPRDCLQMLQDIGALMMLGNHEWTTLAAMQDDSDSTLVWRDIWLKHYESKTLNSYGVQAPDNPAHLLRERMQSLGHLAFLETAHPYLETPDFIVIHAGLDDSPWQEQKNALDRANQNRLNGNYDDEPVQIFDLRFKLSTQQQTDASKKLVISGHAHNRTTTVDNYSNSTKRLKLSSGVNRGLPLFVWESWTGKIVPF